MRTLSEAEKYWGILDDFHSLRDLKISVSSHNEPRVTAGMRSVCWKIFLLFKTLERSSWPDRLAEARAAYDSLRSHHLRAIQHPDEFESSVDPLTESEESPWVALRADESLRAEIFQDIERCMPDNVYFRQPATQNMMLDILFVFCKLNPDIGYRQGMHEVLAPILWVVERDAVDAGGLEKRGADRTLAEMLDSKYIEHDSFTLYTLVMQTAKYFYAPVPFGSTAKETPMLTRSARIFERYLPKADPELAAHLVKLEIVPQIFLLRWIRLLFGREFPLDSVLHMWDALFAIDATLELVDMISIAMLLRIRWQLIGADTNEAFSFLLRYPEPDAPAYTFINDALYLRDHLTPEGGAEIITRYGKKAPAVDRRVPVIRTPSPPSSYTSSRTRHSAASSRSFMTPPGGGLEALIQGAAKGVLDRGSHWNVGKAIRDAVGEVKRNVEAYQSGTVSATASGRVTPRAGGRENRKPGRISALSAGKPPPEHTTSENIVSKIESLERRNKSLAKMLESTITELWDYHKGRSEDSKEDKDSIEALSLTIAKVQFVQVYLEDSSVPLPVDENAESITATPTSNMRSPNLAPSPIDRSSSAPPASAMPQSPLTSSTPNTSGAGPVVPPQPTSSTANRMERNSPVSPKPTPFASHEASASSSGRSRPFLTQSAFSWMLGQEETPSSFASASAHTAFPSDEKRRMKGSSSGKGFLFGDEDDTGTPMKEGKRGSVSGKGRSNAEPEVEEEVIDLEDVGRRRAVS